MALGVGLFVVQVQVDRPGPSLGEVDRLGRFEEGMTGSIEDCT
jgi:hypothetical protein